MELRPIKTWTVTKNQLAAFDATIAYGGSDIPNGYKLLLIDVYANMIASGKWAVRGSSDASTAAMDNTNRLSVVADVRFTSGANIHSWIVLEQLATGMHVLWNHQYGNDGGSKHNMELYVSRNAFTGGSTTARPTTTEEALVRSGKNPSGLLDKWHQGQSSVDYRWHAWHSTDGTVTMIGCWQSGTLRSWWEFTELRYAADEWLTPWAISMVGGVNNSTDFFDYDSCWVNEEFQAIYCPQLLFYSYAFPYTTTHSADNDAGATVLPIFRQITAVNPTSNEIDCFPAGVFNTAGGYYGMGGYYFDKYWSGVGVTGDLHPDEDGDNWVKLGTEGVFVYWGSADVFQTS